MHTSAAQLSQADFYMSAWNLASMETAQTEYPSISGLLAVEGPLPLPSRMPIELPLQGTSASCITQHTIHVSQCTTPVWLSCHTLILTSHTCHKRVSPDRPERQQCAIKCTAYERYASCALLIMLQSHISHP